MLAGASGGGLLVVNYAGRYPDQVAGVVLLDVPAPNKDLDKEMPGAMGWRNPEHLDYVAAERQLALHPPSLGDIPLLVVTTTSGQSECEGSVVPGSTSSSQSQQTTVEGGHDLSREYPDVVIPEIQSALDAIQG